MGRGEVRRTQLHTESTHQEQLQNSRYNHLNVQSAVPGRGGITRITAAFWSTASGLREGLTTEAAIKQEVIIAFVAVPFSILIARDLWTWVALVATLLFVLSIEFLNTAIERL